ncbi:MAG: hypothetical protein IH969_08415, partial [Candidatus Krumholzibacteriota bacterium]|nr:hypothetical protein [Candidatus Krumholzibacteriota bacterium]
MMREAGFDAAVPPGTREKFEELGHLGRSIGRTGRLALMPFLHASSQDRWQLHMLEKLVE